MDSTLTPAQTATSAMIPVQLLNPASEKIFPTATELNSAPAQVVFQELPHHIALSFTIYGCPFACPGCHSEDTWPSDGGQALTDEAFEAQLDRYQGLISAVVFFGGEWHPKALARKLAIAKSRGLITCLYSGAEHLSRSLRQQLDFVKLGPWKESLGGLESATTNQRFMELKDGELWQDRSHWFRTHAL